MDVAKTLQRRFFGAPPLRRFGTPGHGEACPDVLISLNILLATGLASLRLLKNSQLENSNAGFISLNEPDSVSGDGEKGSPPHPGYSNVSVSKAVASVLNPML